MLIQHQNLIPWADSLEDYQAMFALSEHDLQKKLLICAAGPANVVVEMNRQGIQVVACDPLYSKSTTEIETKFAETLAATLDYLQENSDQFIWQGNYASPEAVIEHHHQSLSIFLQDFPAGLAAGRYQKASLPDLSFQDYEFDLALCSYFLFTCGDEFSLDFYLQSIIEMCRVAGEVRLFPVITAEGEISPLLGELMMLLQQQGFGVELKQVPYEFQKGGNAMLRIWSPACAVKNISS